MATTQNEAGPSQEIDEAADEIEKSMGVFGRWQILMVLAIYLVKFPIAWHQLNHVFLAPKAFFLCNNKSNYCGPNCTHIFDKRIFTETIVTQWDLVCDREILATIDQTIAMFGILVGSLICGYLSDKCGRKPPLVGAVVLQGCFGIASAFVPWYSFFLVLRFLTTAATGGYMVISFVLIMELVGVKWRTRMGVLYQIPFNLGHLSLPLFAYFLRDWRYFELAQSVPVFFLVLYYWILPESPRWLLTAQKKDKAILILERAARFNKLPINQIRNNVEMYLERKNLETSETGNFRDLVRTPVIRIYTICIGYNWLVCGMCFYGGAQYIKQLGGNIFVNQALAAVVQVPGTLFALWATKALGRKITLIISDLLGSTCCFLIAFLPSHPIEAKVAFASINMFAMMAAFNTVYIYAGEVFPTVVRNVGVGTCSMCARLGSMVAPFIADAEQLGRIPRWIPPVIFGVVAFVGAMLCFKLPETVDCKLPDTVREAEEMNKNKKWKHFK